MRGLLTSSGWVVTGHLSEVCVVLYCKATLVSPVLLTTTKQVQIATSHANCLPDEYRGEDVRFARKNSPEMLRASQRTTTTFWPLRSCFATVLARRPSRWPLPSIVTYFHISASITPRIYRRKLAALIVARIDCCCWAGTHHWLEGRHLFLLH
jgi:hypothetical protein